MSDFKMGEIIRQIDEERNKKKGVARLLGLLKEGVGGPLKWIAWRLWGRRRAIKRMQLLAGLTDERASEDYVFKPTPVGVIEPFGVSQASHEQVIKDIESLREPLPRPDVVDDPTSN